MKRLSLARSLIIVICVLQFRLCTITTANGHNESSRSTSSKTLPSSQIAEVYSSSKPTIANQDPVTEKHSVKNDSNKANRHQLQHRKQDCRIKINDEQSQMHADGGKELPEISAAMNADEDKFIQASRIVLDNDVRTLNSYSVGEAILMFLVTIVHSSAYHVLYTHRYDNYNDMKLASGPSVNNELCLKQLEDMYSRDERLNRDGLNSTDANLYQILNTWGRAPSGFTLVDMFFEGSYEECLRSKLVSNGEQTGGVDMRYCVMSFKSKDWPQLDKHDLLSIKTAVCIPKTCDSADHRNKYELIWALASRQLGPMSVEDSWKMTGLYCLPDHNSPLRSIRHSPKARIAATCFILWLALLVYATYKYNKIEQRMKLEEANKNLIDDNSSYSESRVKIFRMLSITNNLKLLFSTKKESTIVESSSPSSSSATQIKSKEDQASITPEANHESQREMVQASAGVTSKCENQDRFIDLGCIEGIKVIAMCYIIMGHVVMCMTTVMSNGRDLTENVTGPLVFFLANLVPAFAVNSFFTITGLLTSYLLFKQNKTQPLITSASKWIAIIVFRYLRIMPMYALAVLYCKTLAKYTGSGPLWDYGTSSVSQRHNCEQEPWHWTLTFTSNFLSPMQHCIPGGWYLSNDFQFMLVTPIFMVTLYLKPRFGKALLYVSIIAGYLAGFMSIYSSQTTDLISIAKILPFGFKTYVSHLSFNYTHPQYRIPAYLIGLLIGHKLYHFEEMKKRHAQLSELERSHQPAPCWSDSFKRYGAYSAAVLIAACCMTPLLACRLPFTKDAARFMVSLVTPSYHIFYAFAVGTFIMLATTGHGNRYLTRFLASPHWKPLARLSLCAVLVNVEVINYFVQSSTRQQHITNGYLILLNTICILGTYLAATVACVLFEAPIRSGLNATLAGLMKSMSNKQKQKIR